MKTKLTATLILCAAFAGCATVTQLWQRPETQTGVEGLKKAAFSFASAAAAESVRQFGSTGAVDPAKVATVGGAAALWTAASYIRTLQATQFALDNTAIADKLEAAGIPWEKAAPLAEAVSSNAEVLRSRGVPRDEAAELTAAAFDAAAAAIQEGRK
jgi:hypothetical protein